MPSILDTKGLYTFQNELSKIPQGAFLEALNTVIDRDGIIEQRRGLEEYASFSSQGETAKQLLVYKNRLLRHYFNVGGSVNKLEYDDGTGSFTAFDSTYNEVETGLRIKYAEVNGNLYFTTNKGIKKISATNPSQFSSASGYITNSGGIKALDVTAKINYETSGFFTANRTVAYRVVWGIKDVNGNVILGFPSARTVIANTDSALSATVDLTFTVPGTVTNINYFYQVYRTAVSTSSSSDDPGDEMYLVYEANVTTSDISAKYITINDLVPEDIRAGGALLSTNPSSGDGIEQANEMPPLAKDIAYFKGSLFYANTKTKHRLQVNLLSLTDFTTGSSKFIISDGASTSEYTFVGIKEKTTVQCTAFASITDGSYFLINSASDLKKYFVWMDKTGSTTQPSNSETAGRVPIHVNISGATTASNVATLVKTAIDAEDDFVATVSTTTVTVTNHNNGNTTDSADSMTAATGFTIVTTQQGDGEDPSQNDVLLSALSTPSQQIDETARSLVNIINKNSSEIVNAFYISGPDDVPGAILLEAKTLEDITFYVATNDEDITTKFSPALTVSAAITDISVANPTVITSVAHGLSTGDIVVIYNTDSTPVIDGEYIVTVLDVDTFSVNTEVTVIGTDGVWFKGTVGSDNEIAPNRIYFSKYQQPEAVPITNFFDVGPKDKAIKRVLALRDSLFVLKEDGVYRVSGTSAVPGAGGFSPTLFDSSTNITAADTAAILNNQIYFLSTQGVATVADNGVSVISRAIEDQFLKLTPFTNYTTVSWALGYETDRAYIIWLPTLSSDTYATQAFRFNTFTQSWTKWSVKTTCGVINTNLLYTASGNRNFIDRERKTYTRRDYADREVTLSLGDNAVNATIITLSSTSDVVVGDSLLQTQYLTISQFNRLLKKLDTDAAVNDSDYYTLLGASSGSNLRNKVTSLATKLDADTGVSFTNYTSSLVGTDTFAVTQSDFNIIVAKLNLDTGVFFSNYLPSTGTKEYEAIITDVLDDDDVEVLYSAPFIKGTITVFKGIETSIVWAPFTAGDPSTLKQFREGTIMFEHNTFTSAEIAYSNDLSPSFEGIPFIFPGPGVWGMFVWGNQNWDGSGNSAPLRTLVPRQKQRCRYLLCRFTHNNAMEKYSILGMSLSPRVVSERGYK